MPKLLRAVVRPPTSGQPDLTLRVLGLAMLLLAFGGPSITVAQEVELPPKAREPFIGRIVIEGNVSFSEKDLKRKMMTAEPPFFAIFTKPRLDRETLRRDIAALEAFYRVSGYLDARVTLERIEPVENGAFVEIYIRVEEGEATRVQVVEFEGTGPVPPDKLARDLRLKPGVPFNPTLVNADIYAMKRQYFDRGYLAVVIGDSVTTEGKSVSLFYRVEPGPPYTIRGIEVTGNRLTKPYIIEREFAFKEGETFRLSKAVETQRNLFETGLFTEAEITPQQLDPETRTVDVTVRVRERKSSYFEAGVGVGNILGSRVTGEWGNRNLFGRGRKLRVKAEYSFELFEGGVVNFRNIEPRVKYYRYDAEFGQRHVFGTKILLGINAFLEKDATVKPLTIRTRGAALGGLRHLTPRTDLGARLSDERIEREVPGVETEKSHTRLISSVLSHDTRDFVLDPRRGTYRDLRGELAGGIFGGDNDFYTINTTIQKYWAKRWGSVIAVRSRVGFAGAYAASKDKGVPVENRYFTGGGNSVRGFQENSLGPTGLVTNDQGVEVPTVVGGRFLLVANAEARFPIPYFSRFRFSGAAFVDAGNVWRSVDSVELRDFRLLVKREDVTETDFRYTVGMGIRFNTPVGPIRLDYGIPIKRTDTKPLGRFHLSLGQIF